jgi:uncharacterized membrane protein
MKHSTSKILIGYTTSFSIPRLLSLSSLLSMVFLALTSHTAQAQITFNNLGTLPGDFTSQFAFISKDGKAVAGYSGGLPQMFHWTQESGMVNLGKLLPPEFQGGSIGGISADGNIVVGTKMPEFNRSEQYFKWTPQTGMITIGDLNTDERYNRGAFPPIISADGSTIIGSEIYGGSPNELQRWTAATGAVSLAAPPVALPKTNIIDVSSNATDSLRVSDNGNVVAGAYYKRTPNEFAYGGYALAPAIFHWASGKGAEEVVLDSYALENSRYTLVGMSSDGNTLALNVAPDAGDIYNTKAYIWTPAGGGLNIGSLGGDTIAITDISADGNTIVGVSTKNTNGYAYTYPFRWTPNTGMTGLWEPKDPYLDLGYALRASDDGNVIIGRGASNYFMWTPEAGKVNLEDMLSSSILDWPKPYILNMDISGDGTTLAGTYNKDGQIRAFTVRNEAGWRGNRGNNIPEPATLALLGLGLGLRWGSIRLRKKLTKINNL